MRQATRRRVKARLFQSGVSLCAGLGVAALGAMFLFLLAGAWPALQDQGAAGMLLGTEWQPSRGRYGLALMLCATAASSCGAALLALPAALLAAACARNLLPRRARGLFCGFLELMSGLPSVLLGLIGLMTLLPALARLFPRRMGPSGGATLLAAILVLAAMMLPELTLSLLGDLDEAGGKVDLSSFALGATPMQTVFCAQIPPPRAGMPRRGSLGCAAPPPKGWRCCLFRGTSCSSPPSSWG